MAERGMPASRFGRRLAGFVAAIIDVTDDIVPLDANRATAAPEPMRSEPPRLDQLVNERAADPQQTRRFGNGEQIQIDTRSGVNHHRTSDRPFLNGRLT